MIRSALFLAFSLLLSTTLAAPDANPDATPATTGQPATHTRDVKVGSNGLNFDPDTLTADIGDLINFHFYPQNHSVAQSDYDYPCRPISGGNSKPIFSGFFPAKDGEAKDVFSMRLNSSDPIWLYCSAYEHCKDGQVMVINPTSGGDQTLAKYKDAAKKATPSSPLDVFGGVVHEPKKTTGSTTAASPTKTGGAGRLEVGLEEVVAAAVGGLLLARL